jgi:superoxide dismutase
LKSCLGIARLPFVNGDFRRGKHADYIDYRNLRPKYVEAFWSLANWDFAAENFA